MTTSLKKCRQCEGYYHYPPLLAGLCGLEAKPDTGYCGECRIMRDDPAEVMHDHLIRCPACGHMKRPDFETPVWTEDGGDVWCEECDSDFHVETSITYTFTSPPREVADAD